MKKILTLFISLFLAMTADAQLLSQPQKWKLPDTWEFRQAHTEKWWATKAPVSVHTALQQNGLIEDPFYRDNEEKLQWIEKEDWEFQTTFDVPEHVFQKKHIELVLKNIDTYAHVYLNDSLVAETDNMFRTWQVDVKKWIKPTGNKLHIYFESPINKIADEWKNLGYELPGGTRTMTRKAQFHYGWDWGPRFVGCGVLKMPVLAAWDDFVIEDIVVVAQSIGQEVAKMVARFRYRSDISTTAMVLTRADKRKNVEERIIYPGVHEDSVTFDVNDPKLWWCVGMGEPNLYDFQVEIKKKESNKLLDVANVRTGIRSIQLVTEKDANGESFYFKLNGRRVFCKGANYIPQSNFQDRVTPKDYVLLLNDVVSSNMNMLRVWGGGIYEDDLFYDLCDAKGIMVWQDFMYACAMYPGSGSFLKSASKEALEQIERLRQHPCLALWCGNNENNEAWHNWGWQMNFNEAQRTRLWRDYTTLFNDLLPNYVANFAGGVPYWESSPKFGRFNPKSNSEGDSHYWGVWHDEEPFSIFNKKVPRFMSEYGFQSFPEWRTIESFTLPEDRVLDSKVMLLHQKHPRGNALIAEYMKRDYRSTKNFEEFVYVSQLLQAEGMRTGIEAHRRNKPYCMGTLYWQLNDVWPVASWSGRDCFGHWKALQYYVRESFSPVAALPIAEDDIIRLYSVSDLPKDSFFTVEVKAMDFGGKVLSLETMPKARFDADSSKMIWQGYTKTVLKKNKPENSLIVFSIKSAGGDVLYRRIYYLVPPKNLSLSRVKIRTSVVQVNDGYQLTLETDDLAKNVHIMTQEEGFFQDNYFDLLPGERKTVLFKTQRILSSPTEAFRVKSLVDTY